MTVVYFMLAGLAVLAFVRAHFLRRFEREFIERDPGCPIRDSRRVEEHVLFFKLGQSDEKDYLKKNAPTLVLVLRTAEVWMLLTGVWFLLIWLSTVVK